MGAGKRICPNCGRQWNSSSSGCCQPILMAMSAWRANINLHAVHTTSHRSSPASFGVTSDFQLYGCVHVENLLPDFCKRKSSPSILESEPCKSKIGTGSVEFRTQKFLGTVLGTKSRFRDKKPPKVTSKYTKALSWNYQTVTRFHKKNGISKLATFS